MKQSVVSRNAEIMGGTPVFRGTRVPVQLPPTTALFVDPITWNEVTWSAGRERRGRTSVSIRKHGERRAFRMACAIRREKEREMYGEAVEGKWAGALAKVCAA